jgi:hypothetical protein
MRRWDRLVETYIEEYRARGIGAERVASNTAILLASATAATRGGLRLRSSANQKPPTAFLR